LIKLVNNRGYWDIDINNLSDKDRLYIQSYLLKFIECIKLNLGLERLIIDDFIAEYGDLLEQETLWKQSILLSYNYDIEFIFNFILKIVNFYDINKNQYTNVDENKFTIANLKIEDLANIIKKLYELVEIKDPNSNINDTITIKSLDLDSTIYKGLDFHSFMIKLLKVINLYHGVNDVDYLFNNFYKTKELQEQVLFHAFLLLISPTSKELDIYFKIIDDVNYNNIGANLLGLLKRYQLFHISNSNKNTYTKSYLDILDFITPENENMCYNTFIDSVINKMVKYDEEKKKNNKHNKFC
jgi:hypothetical protein